LANVKTLQQYTWLTPLLNRVPLVLLSTKGLDTGLAHVQINHAGMTCSQNVMYCLFLC